MQSGYALQCCQLVELVLLSPVIRRAGVMVSIAVGHVFVGADSVVLAVVPVTGAVVLREAAVRCVVSIGGNIGCLGL